MWRDGNIEAWNIRAAGRRFAYRTQQFDLLKDAGLMPDHYFLDFWCGWLRAGLMFIEYLDVGHYYGIDKEEAALAAGVGGLKIHKLESKEPVLMHNTDIDFVVPHNLFDFALAQSVFSHMCCEAIERTLIKIMTALKPKGVFFATTFIAKDFYLGPPHKNRKGEYSRSDQPVSYYEDFCADHGIVFDFLDDFGHPDGQKLLKFSS